jgi:hypothetical protein
LVLPRAADHGPLLSAALEQPSEPRPCDGGPVALEDEHRLLAGRVYDRGDQTHEQPRQDEAPYTAKLDHHTQSLVAKA